MSVKTIAIKSVFILSVMTVFFLSGCRTFETSPPDGPYQVGVNVQVHTLGDNSGLQLTTWYPAQPEPGADPYMTEDGISGTAVLNADFDPSGGPYPLIVFSPGFGASGNQYYFYTQNLASHGYVVIGIDHLDKDEMTNNFGSGLPDLENFLDALQQTGEQNGSDGVLVLAQDWFVDTEYGMTYRPQEIAYAKQQVVNWNQDPSSMFYGMIDTNNMGMTGHSLGGFHTLLQGGMPLLCDYELTLQQCDLNQVHITDYDICCMPSIGGLEDPFALKDDRIKAILPLAPPIMHADSQIARNAAEIDIPLMFITGDDPYFEATLATQWEVYTNASTPKYFVKVRRTDHFVVFDLVETLQEWAQLLLPGNNHTFFTYKARAYKDYSAAFFNMYLKGDTSGLSTMHAPNQYFVKDVWYQE